MCKLVEAIEQYAARRCISVATALTELQVSGNIFYGWKKNGATPRFQTIGRIAAMLGVDPSELVDGHSSSLTAPTTTLNSNASKVSDEGTVVITMRLKVFNELKPILGRFNAEYGVMRPVANGASLPISDPHPEAA